MIDLLLALSVAALCTAFGGAVSFVHERSFFVHERSFSALAWAVIGMAFAVSLFRFARDLHRAAAMDRIGAAAPWQVDRA